jgi:hypothetical protein
MHEKNTLSLRFKLHQQQQQQQGDEEEGKYIGHSTSTSELLSLHLPSDPGQRALVAG